MPSLPTPRLHALGDRAIVIELGDTIDPETHAHVRDACARIERARVPGVIELVPAYASVTVHYEPVRVGALGQRAPHEILREALARALDEGPAPALAPTKRVEIPVRYGGEFGPDLEELARAHDLSPRDVVEIHCATEYLVYLVGFVPGFPYLGGLDPRLATARRAVPRTSVPAGSVAIGGAQTGIYPIASPGGWHVIGRTPLALFDATRASPSLLAMGDRVRFVPLAS